MKEPISLKIADPCHEDWSKMTPEAKGRFCAACDKVVIDFSQMSDGQILDHFSKTSGKTCGRFYGDQLNRRLVSPPANKFGTWKYLWHVALPLLLISTRAAAQVKWPVDTITQPAPDLIPKTVWSNPVPVGIRRLGTIEDKVYSTNFVVFGKLQDRSGNPIFGATVAVKGTNIATSADTSGTFTLKIKDNPEPILVFSAVGFATQEEKISNFQGKEAFVKVKMTTMQYAVMGEVIITRKKSRKKSSFFNFSKKNESVCSKPEETAVLNVFPNPFQTNGTVSLKNIQPGDYNITLYNMDGIAIHQQSAFVKSNVMQETITLTNTQQPGVYAVKVNGRGKTYTTTLFIQ